MSKKAPLKKEETPVAKASEASKEAKIETKTQKVEKPKGSEKHKGEKGIHAMYKIEGEKAVRTHPTCERCGTGYFMGDHKDRYTCGHCGFTRYKTR